MGKDRRQKLEWQASHGRIKTPLSVQKKWDRRNFDVGEERDNRNKLRYKDIENGE